MRGHPSSSGEIIRVFIGTEPKTEIARKVLEFSIIRRTEAEVRFTPMIGPRWEYSTEGFNVGTGFSLRRWMIPEFCEFKGRAIYLDADQLVFGDIWELWQRPEIPIKLAPKDERPAHLGCSTWLTYQQNKYYSHPSPQSSVMVIDCEAAKNQWGWHLDRVLPWLRQNNTRDAYVSFMHCDWMQPPPARIETGWNHLNAFDKEKTKLLHYTKEPEQPWYKPEHPLAYHWRRELIAALAANVVTDTEIRAAVAKFNVKEDWRDTNGLHPEYLQFLEIRPEHRKKTNRRVDA